MSQFTQFFRDVLERQRHDKMNTTKQQTPIAIGARVRVRDGLYEGCSGLVGRYVGCGESGPYGAYVYLDNGDEVAFLWHLLEELP